MTLEEIEFWSMHVSVFRDNLHLLEEGQGMPREELDERIAREEFRRPRESLLNICTEFYKHCGPRLKILQNVAGEPRVRAGAAGYQVPHEVMKFKQVPQRI